MAGFVWEYKIPILRLDLFLGGFMCGASFVIFGLLYFLWQAVFSPPPAGAPENGQQREIKIPQKLQEFYRRYRGQKGKTKRLRRSAPLETGLTAEEGIAATIGVPERETCVWFNMLLAHIFIALRDTRRMQLWWKYFMLIELAELKEDAKILETITVREYDLGNSVPYFSDVSVTESLLEPEQKLTLVGDIEYTGGLHVTLDMALPFHIPAAISLTLVSLRGRARMEIHPGNPAAESEIDREACYSISFLEEPEMEVKAESTLKGKAFDNISTLLVHQIKRLVRTKHVLPAFKKKLLITDEDLRGKAPVEPPARPPAARPLESMGIPIIQRSRPITPGSLQIRVDAAANIQMKDTASLFGDRVFVSLQCPESGDELRTSTAKLDGNVAVWNESMTLYVSSDCRHLNFSIYAQNIFSKDEQILRGKILLSDIINLSCPDSKQWVRVNIPLTSQDGPSDDSCGEEEEYVAGEGVSLLGAGVEAMPVVLGGAKSASAADLIATPDSSGSLQVPDIRNTLSDTNILTYGDAGTEKSRGTRSGSVRGGPSIPVLTCYFLFKPSISLEVPLANTASIPSSPQTGRGSPFPGPLLRVHKLEKVSKLQLHCCAVCAGLVFGASSYQCVECSTVVHKRCVQSVRDLVCPGPAEPKPTTDTTTKPSDQPNSKEDDDLPAVHIAAELLGTDVPQLVVVESEGEPVPVPGMHGVASLVDLISRQLAEAVSSRQRLAHLLARVTAVEREQIEQQMRKHRQFSRRRKRLASGNGVVPESESYKEDTEHMQSCLQAIQVVLAKGEEEKARINESIELVDGQMMRLAHEMHVCCSMLEK